MLSSLVFNPRSAMNTVDQIHRELLDKSHKLRLEARHAEQLQRIHYILPLDLMKLVISFIPSYYISWVDGFMTIKRDTPLSPPPPPAIRYTNFADFTPNDSDFYIEYDNENEYDENDEYEEYEEYDEYTDHY